MNHFATAISNSKDFSLISLNTEALTIARYLDSHKRIQCLCKKSNHNRSPAWLKSH